MIVLRLLFIAVMTLSAPSLHAKETTNSRIEISVNGMVCDFCAQSVWKVFQDYKSVHDIDVNLDQGIVTVFLKNNMTLTDAELQKGITYAGYDLVGIKRIHNER